SLITEPSRERRVARVSSPQPSQAPNPNPRAATAMILTAMPSTRFELRLGGTRGTLSPSSASGSAEINIENRYAPFLDLDRQLLPRVSGRLHLDGVGSWRELDFEEPVFIRLYTLVANSHVCTHWTPRKVSHEPAQHGRQDWLHGDREFPARRPKL